MKYMAIDLEMNGGRNFVFTAKDDKEAEQKMQRFCRYHKCNLGIHYTFRIATDKESNWKIYDNWIPVR